MLLFYNIGISLFWFGVRLASLWNEKAKSWIKGRKDWYSALNKQFGPDENVIWFHCASLGEFEQGRPLIEMAKENIPDTKILLTFSSPSGYEKRKNYDGVDFVSYLPLDTKRNAKKFINALPLKAVIFIKYEFWYHYLNELSKKCIPLFLASGIFRPDQIFFKWYGSWYSSFLKCFSHMFVQGEESKELLNSIGFNDVTVAGDTRFDRVARVVQTNYQNNSLEKFSESGKVIVAGSTWEADEELLAHAYQALPADYKWIIAPHELSGAHIKRLKNLFTGSLLFTEIDGLIPSDVRVIILDTMGQLSFIYRYGTISYIGGGFGKGIHNVLEAATYGLPIIIGPRYQKFSEAIDLVESGGAFAVHNGNELLSTIRQQFSDLKLLKTSSEISRNYVQSKLGATSVIMEKVCKKTGLDML